MKKKVLKGRIVKNIIIIIFALWNIYFYTHLIFFTDKFIKPYVNINSQDYYVNSISDSSVELSLEQKVADFQYMVEFLNENYPLEHIDEEIYKINIDSKNKEYLQKVKNSKSDFEFFLVLRQYFSSVKSAHTYLMIPDLNNYENMRVNNMNNLLENNINIDLIKYWEDYLSKKAKNCSLENIVTYNNIDGKYYNNDNYESYITHINNDTIQIFVDKYNSILTKKYNHVNKSLYYDKLIFNSAQGEQVLIRLNNGNEIPLYISSEYEFAYVYNNFNNIWEPKIFYTINQEKRLCYYRIDSFEIKYLNEIKKLSEEITERRDAFDYIVFDVRKNGGGQLGTFIGGILNFFVYDEHTFKIKSFTPYTEYHSEFKSKSTNNDIVKKPIKNIKAKANYYYGVNIRNKYGSNKANTLKKMFVLIDEGTCSAADTFAAIMKTGEHAILVGQNTAGEGLADTSSIFSLPNSGLLISFMGSYGSNEDGTSNSQYGTVPDYYISQDISHYIKGKDINNNSEYFQHIMLYDRQLKFIVNNLIEKSISCGS
ncbi:MAG: S41 family peptidase [Ruminiclostridium sp.]|nr:S41 family peptidase [Ruminiclostridium sp.]